MPLNASVRQIVAFATILSGLSRPLLSGIVLMAFLSTFGSGALAAEPNVPAFTSYVTDSAGILGTRGADIEGKLRDFEAATGHQVVVLTVPTTGSRSMEEYAVKVFEQWKPGRARIDDGVLFVIATADHKMRIEVGYGLEGRLTDAQCSRIIHDVVAPRFQLGQYDLGIMAGVDAIFRTLAPQLPVAPAKATLQAHTSQPTPAWAVALFGAIVIALLIGSVFGGLPVLIMVATVPLGLLFVALPGHNAWWLSSAVISAWLYGRWLLIAKNVRKYRLRKSKNRFLTWLWAFCEPGTCRPLRKGEKPFFETSFSFVSSDSSQDCSSDESDTCGNGGRSGGAGASGGWS